MLLSREAISHGPRALPFYVLFVCLFVCVLRILHLL